LTALLDLRDTTAVCSSRGTNLSVPSVHRSKLFHVRPVTQGDVYRAESEEIPRIFQVGGAFLFCLDAHAACIQPHCLLFTLYLLF